jgi:hypothetical protein
VFGWFKGTPSRDQYNILFRLTPNKDYGDGLNLGDNALIGFISWPQSSLVFPTYTFDQ